jgi:hypothetical protein
MRLASVNLGPWGQFLPLAAQVRGRAEANLSIKEPLGAGIPTRIEGPRGDRPAHTVVDSRQEVAGASRIEGAGLQLHWPSRLVVGRLSLTGPRGIHRARSGRQLGRSLP